MRRASALTLCCVLAGVMAFTWSASPIVAQAPAAKAVKSTYVVPKTPWGDPDLQGLWPATDMINVPMQRPAAMGTRTELTDEEFKAREVAAQRTTEADAEVFVKPGTKAGINPPSY